MDLIIVVSLLSLGSVKGQFFEDRRCRCVCPSPASVLNTTVTRQIYTGNVPPNQCHCEGVVYSQIQKDLEGKLHIFCPKCECVFERRNTTLIMGVVFMIITTIVMSVMYMGALLWLKFLLGRRSHERSQLERYHEDNHDFARGQDHNHQLLMSDRPKSDEEAFLLTDLLEDDEA